MLGSKFKPFCDSSTGSHTRGVLNMGISSQGYCDETVLVSSVCTILLVLRKNRWSVVVAEFGKTRLSTVLRMVGTQ